MTSFGVFAGARRPNHCTASYPGRPASATVGILGTALDRFALVTPQALTRPLFTCGRLTTVLLAMR
jgi:hypothetical protein